MSSTFFGISTAQSAIAAQRRAMDVLGYNIAHANDPTYKRQRVVMVENAVLAQAQEANPLGTSAFGAGVTSGGIERVRDSLIENRLRSATNAAAEWEYKSSTMTKIEAMLAEPSEAGLQTELDQFWASWLKVATSPEPTPIRGALLEDANALCNRIQYVYNQIRDVTDDLNMAAIDRVDKINSIVEEIGRLNSEIGALKSGELPVNDLLNRRDALVQELSKMIDVGQYGNDRDNFVITLGGRILVQNNLVNKLDVKLDAYGNQMVTWKADGEKAYIPGGELKAIEELRDVMIPDYLSQLDRFAETLVDQVNTLHLAGKTLSGTDGGYFFTPGTSAANISIDIALLDHPELVAASSSGDKGDGGIAEQIAALKNIPVSGGFTINELYTGLVGDIGGATAVADRQAIAHGLSLQQFTTQQQQVSGVSLDEEMSNMIQFQQAYNAAARCLTVIDEMLGVLIERTGAVGR